MNGTIGITTGPSLPQKLRGISIQTIVSKEPQFYGAPAIAGPNIQNLTSVTIKIHLLCLPVF